MINTRRILAVTSLSALVLGIAACSPKGNPPAAGSTASSIVDCAHGTPRVIRLGTISLDDLSQAAGVSIDAPQGGNA